MGQGNDYISCNYSCTIYFSVKILLVKVPLHSVWLNLNHEKKIVTKMRRLKRWWYLSKLLTITITSFNFSNCPVNCKRIWNWNLDQNLIMTLIILAFCTVVWKALYNFKVKRALEARHNQFFFQNFQNNEISETFKMFKNNSWINVYYTKSKHLQSLDCLFCFQLEIPFLSKFDPKTQNYQFKLKFCT